MPPKWQRGGGTEGGRTDGQEFKRETVRVHLPSDLEADRVTNSEERECDSGDGNSNRKDVS